MRCVQLGLAGGGRRDAMMTGRQVIDLEDYLPEEEQEAIRGSALVGGACPVCGAPFHSDEELAEHARVHGGPPVGAYRCPSCGTMFPDAGQFADHARSHATTGTSGSY